MSRESENTATRQAIDSVAAKVRNEAARNGEQLTHTDARERVQQARERGDRNRDSHNR
jgi:hypothetical protein